jgi:pyruvate dehydrogenase E2 component (dihydrolipoamide acetyltransferase)
MPQLGETVAEGTVTKWFKQIGDAVVKGEPLFEVSTDKVDTEIPSPTSGFLTAIHVDEGKTVDVGTPLATIGDGESSAASSAISPEAAPVRSTSALTSAGENPSSTRYSPAVRKLLETNNLRGEDIEASGPHGRLTRDDVVRHLSKHESTISTSNASLSPVVRKLLIEHGLDASTIEATGPDGRLTRRDVENAVGRSRDAVTPSSNDTVVPFSKIRQLTAEHMVRSKATSAHTLMVREVDFEHVEGVRRHHGAQFKEREGFSLTYLPFVALAVLEGLRAYPHLNASVGDNELIVHRDLNLGIAVDLDSDGLVVPVIRHADQLDLVAMARAIRQHAERARAKKLTIDDLAGGTFTITNPGPYGTLMTGAIINQPQVAILATDAVARRPVVVTSPDGGESISIHSIGLMALTFDHRAIDGATAAKFLDHVARNLADRDWIHEHE